LSLEAVPEHIAEIVAATALDGAVAFAELNAMFASPAGRVAQGPG